MVMIGPFLSASCCQYRIMKMVRSMAAFTYAGTWQDMMTIQPARTLCEFFDRASLQAEWPQTTAWRAW
jgi:hypothetical protein